jgi:hypothetical protein
VKEMTETLEVQLIQPGKRSEDILYYGGNIAYMLSSAYNNLLVAQHETYPYYCYSARFQFFVDRLQHAQRNADYIGLDISAFVTVIEQEYPSYLFNVLEAISQAPFSGTDIVDLMELAKSAKQCSLILGEDAEDRVTSLLAETYDIYLTVSLGKARDLAQQGDMQGFSLELDNARTCAKSCVHKDVTPQIDEIERIGYKKALSVQLTKAAYCAREGSINFESHLDNAAFCAKKLGISLDTRVVAEITSEAKTTVTEAYFNTINALLETDDANLGVNSVLWSATSELRNLRGFAHKFGVDITDRVTRLYQSSYRSALDRELEKVEHYARAHPVEYGRDGKFPLEFYYLGFCKEYARAAGVDISAKVAAINTIMIEKVHTRIAVDDCKGCRDFLAYFYRTKRQ